MWPKLGCERTSTKRKTLMPVKRRTRRVAEHETRRFPRIRTEEVTVAATFRKLDGESSGHPAGSAGCDRAPVARGADGEPRDRGGGDARPRVFRVQARGRKRHGARARR